MSHIQTVFNAAKAAGLTDAQAKIIVAQAQHESANFTSNVFKTDNNLFGMKMPSKRPRTYIERPSKIIMQSEGSTPYAHYVSITDSVNDLVKGWHSYNKTNWSLLTTPALYSAYLKSKGYYGDAQAVYTNALNRFFASLPNLKYVAAGSALFLIIGIGLFIYFQNR